MQYIHSEILIIKLPFIKNPIIQIYQNNVVSMKENEYKIVADTVDNDDYVLFGICLFSNIIGERTNKSLQLILN